MGKIIIKIIGKNNNQSNWKSVLENIMGRKGGDLEKQNNERKLKMIIEKNIGRKSGKLYSIEKEW